MLNLLNGLFFLFFLFVHADNKIAIPGEVMQILAEQYPTSTMTMTPEREDMTILLKSGNSEQTIKVGLTQETLDLANYVDKKWDHFNIQFTPPFAIEGDAQLFFINRYKPSTEKGAEGGLPCGKALKIHSKLDKLFTTQGIKLMTNGGRYLNLLGGDFLLTHLENQHFRIVYFKIVDSRFPNRLCKIGL
jgi:hypothetical protein